MWNVRKGSAKLCVKERESWIISVDFYVYALEFETSHPAGGIWHFPLQRLALPGIDLN